MPKMQAIALLSVLSCACAPPDGETFDTDGPPALLTRALAVSPRNNFGTMLAPRQLDSGPVDPDSADDFAWRSWRADAGVLGLDARKDASAIAMTGAIGSCGITDDVVLAKPADRADRFVARIGAAVATWRARHPPRPSEESEAAVDPAVAGWVPSPQGQCTILQLGDDDQLGVTLTEDGLLLLHATPFGNACAPEPEPAFPSELDDAP